jgi:photosynthetic reaction center H subunit
MPTVGAITSHIDVAQVVLYAFWIFFLGLVLYLRREDQREGYPLVHEEGPSKPGYFYPPPAKPFALPGGDVRLSNRSDRDDLAYEPSSTIIGMPVDPKGDALKAGVGPGSYANRVDVPDKTFDGHNRIVPTRAAGEYGVMEGDRDPRGYTVVGSDDKAAGKVVDLWVDKAEFIFRYYEVELEGAGRRALLPTGFAFVNNQRRMVFVDSITSAQFDDVPTIKNPDEVTRLEEDKIMAFYGGGYLYSNLERAEPVL